MYPALAAPHRERLAGSNAKKIYACVGLIWAEFGPGEPTTRKFVSAVGHVFSTEHTKAQHFRWREIRPEAWIKVAPDRRDENVPITLLHPIIHSNGSLLHRDRILLRGRLNKARDKYVKDFTDVPNFDQPRPRCSFRQSGCVHALANHVVVQ